MRGSYPDAWFLSGCATTHASPPAITWIGYEHPDRLRTSGYLNNLSRCVVPIRIRGSYPDAWFLSRTRAGRLTPPIAGLPTPPRASSTPPQHTQPIRIRSAQARSAAMSPPHPAVRHCRNTHPTTYTAPHPAVRHCRNTHPTTYTAPHTTVRHCRNTHPTTRTPPHGAHPIRHAHLARHARLAQPHPAPASGANKTHTQRAYKTRPDQPVRARNVFGSGVRTLAVVRAVLTTIATLTTPLRHVILLGFVV